MMNKMKIEINQKLYLYISSGEFDSNGLKKSAYFLNKRRDKLYKVVSKTNRDSFDSFELKYLEDIP